MSIVCVWTSRSSTGSPKKLFRRGAPVSLIAAWRLGPIRRLSSYQLAVRWQVFAGFQADVSLMPPKVFRVAERTRFDPSAPQAGTFRLVDAPVVKRLRPGWYSVVAQASLYGAKCPRFGCAGKARENRFFMK